MVGTGWLGALLGHGMRCTNKQQSLINASQSAPISMAQQTVVNNNEKLAMITRAGRGAGARLGHGEHALGVVVAVALLVTRRRHVGWPARIARCYSITAPTAPTTPPYPPPPSTPTTQAPPSSSTNYYYSYSTYCYYPTWCPPCVRCDRPM